jgi:uncharacterized protein (DUF302 family)
MFSRRTITRIAFAFGLAASATSAFGQTAPAPFAARPGWRVIATPHAFPALVKRLEDAIRTNQMGLVTVASASDGAAAQGISIRGNRVVGVFRNDFARRMLSASVPAGIEAPIRFYLTENADHTSTLSWITPSAVFAPYFDTAGPELKKVAVELDPIFEKIGSDAARP